MTGPGVLRELERLRFGAHRTLNVREAGHTGSEAGRRVDGWLRAKQLELDGDVLIITGRGAGSRDGIAVVRDATLRTLRALKRSGVIRDIQEETAGSFVVSLAPLRALLEAPVRRKTPAEAVPAPPLAIEGIERESRRLLAELATRALDSLGVSNPNATILRDEMERQFTLLVRGLPRGPGAEAWLRQAIARGLLDYE